MEVKVLKTFELTDKDWNRIVSGFNRTFNRNTTKERLVGLYTSSVTGYSYHAVGYEHDTIAGFTSVIPFRYLYKEQEFNVGLMCSAFVLQEYRGAFLFKELSESLKAVCLKQGCTVLLGVPNKNSHKYLTAFLGFNNVDTLPYYALPVRWLIVLKKDNFLFVNAISAFLVTFFCFVNKVFSWIIPLKEKRSVYQLLITDEFLEKRFSASCYTRSTRKNIKFCYRMVDEQGIKAAYLMDFRENNNRTNKALCTAVWHILRKEKTDIILYVGTLRLKQGLLLKVPLSFTPKPLPLIFNILDLSTKEQFDAMSDMNLWDFGLINFDGR